MEALNRPLICVRVNVFNDCFRMFYSHIFFLKKMFQYVFTIAKKVCKRKFKTYVEQVGYSKHKMLDLACRNVAYCNDMSGKFL